MGTLTSQASALPQLGLSNRELSTPQEPEQLHWGQISCQFGLFSVLLWGSSPLIAQPRTHLFVSDFCLEQARELRLREDEGIVQKVAWIHSLFLTGCTGAV